MGSFSAGYWVLPKVDTADCDVVRDAKTCAVPGVFRSKSARGSTYGEKLPPSLWLPESNFQPIPNSSARAENGDPNKHVLLHFSQKQAFETPNHRWAVILPAQPSPGELLFGVVFTTHIAVYARRATTATALLPKR